MNGNVQNVNHQMIEEDEIDLRELWQTIKKGKKIIIILTTVIVSLTLVYVLKLPNEYKSSATLIPTESSSPSLGGLGGLAAMAGVSLGGGGSMTPDVAFQSLLNNYEFMKNFVKKHKIVEHYYDNSVDKNYVFALGFRGVYDFFNSKKEIEDYDKAVYQTVQSVIKSFSVDSDKKTSLVTISFSDKDRSYTPKMVNWFLDDASEYLVKNSLKNTDEKLNYFEKEFEKANSVEIRQSLSQTISKILENKVILQSKRYYQCNPLTMPYEPYIKDKTKPKRSLILVVSFVTSIILGVFLVFFLEFLKAKPEE